LVSRDRILQQVQRIGGMANELLEFARGSQPSRELVPVNFAAFMEKLLEEITGEAATNSVQVKIESRPPSVLMRIDPARFSRVFHNLIQNAMDAMPTGGTLIFRFQREDAAVLTEVEDTGPGIAPEMKGQLFEPFSTHGKPTGTGLGLTICKRIIEDHRGKIFTRAESGRGAIFGFTLPIPSA
ncbi:MAG: HAMP domain-containing sensor histidine kinase, partial [Verrucomicrobiota bacterium]